MPNLAGHARHACDERQLLQLVEHDEHTPLPGYVPVAHDPAKPAALFESDNAQKYENRKTIGER